MIILPLVVLFFFTGCQYGCIKTNLTQDEKDWFNVYSKSKMVVFESNLNNRDTFDISDIHESYSVCNRFELGKYQKQSMFFEMKPRKCRAKSSYCSIDLDFVKETENEPCVKYFRVFDCSVQLTEIPKKKEIQISLKDGSSFNALFFESNTGAPDSDYSVDIESFYWSEKYGIIRYTTLTGETFDLLDFPK